MKKTPKKEGFLQDLVTDLKNRRLIPVIVALVVAIIAVPLLISGPDVEESTEAEAGVGSVALDPAATSEAVPAVLAQQPVLRDTEVRLDNFKKKNPFKQQLTGPTKAEQRAIRKALQQEQQALKAGSGGGASGGTGSFGSGDSIGSSSTSAGSTSSDSTSTPTDTGGAGGSSSGGGQNAEEGVLLLTYEVDVKVGPVGKAREQKGVEQLDFLPNNTTRVFQFVGSDVEGTEATFAVSPDAKQVEGDGSCKPKKGRCELLTLEPGEEHKVRYEPNGKTYRLKLQKVTRNEEFVPADEVDDLRFEDIFDSFREGGWGEDAAKDGADDAGEASDGAADDSDSPSSPQ